MYIRFLFILIIIFHFGCILCNHKRENTSTVGIQSHKINKREIVHKFSVPQIVSDLSLLSKFRDDIIFNLKCDTIGSPNPTVKWFQCNTNSIRYNGFNQIIGDPFIINSEGELHFSKDSSVLSFYYCSASNVFGTVFSKKTEVQKMFWTGNVAISYETSAIKPGAKAVIECIITPNLVAKDYVVREWIIKANKDGEERIHMTEGRYSVISVTKFPQLHIDNVTKDDFKHMHVRCVVENKFSRNIVIDHGLQWTQPKQFDSDYGTALKYDKCQGSEVTAAKGTTTELPWCSHPKARSVVWYKSNSPSLSMGEPVQLMPKKYELQSGNLRILNVDITDEGYYFVRLDSQALVDYTPFQLRVTVKIGLEVNEPERWVAVGTRVEFKCVVTGYPRPDVFWLHNGKNAIVDKTVNSGRTKSTSVLVVAKVTTETAGVYQCVAESRAGSDGRLQDFGQKTMSVSITQMPPRLVSQFPAVPLEEPYANTRLDNDNSNVNIQCSFYGIPEPSIQWYLDDRPISIENVINLKVSTKDPYTKVADLQTDLKQLSSIGDRWKYGGMYVAKATNEFGSAECMTMVYVESVFRIRDQEKITLKHGQQWTLKCYVISDGRPDISWLKILDGGKKINFPETHMETETLYKREILIKKVVKDIHDASYECTAQLGPLKASKTFNVSVVMPPSDITETFKEVAELKTENTITLICQPKGTLDMPWYSWWELQSLESDTTMSEAKPLSGHENIDGLTVSYGSESRSNIGLLPLPAGVPHFLINKSNNMCKISIQSQKKLHMSRLTCVVQNHAGVIRRGFRISIAVIEFDELPPLKVNVTLGGTLTLNCSAKPNQLGTVIEWSRDGVKVPLYDPNIPSVLHRFSNGTLIVTNMTGDGHSHDFMCMIKSNSTEPISRIAKVSLKVPAQIRYIPEKMDFILNNDYDLDCPVYGDSDGLVVMWQRSVSQQNNKWIQEDDVSIYAHPSTKMTHYKLKFRHITHGKVGRYRCVATNVYRTGSVNREVQVDVVAVPGPVALHPIDVSSRTITVRWKEPVENGNRPIIDYLVIWKSVLRSDGRNVTSTDITISDIRPNTRYNVSIRARNKVGLGEEVNLEVTTKEDSPEGPVQDLQAVASSSSTIVLTWQPPDGLLHNGRITNYELCHRQLSIEEFSTVNITMSMAPLSEPQNSKKSVYSCESVNVTKRVLHGLPKFTGYGFRVRAENGVGKGPGAFVKARTMEDSPDKAPINVTYTHTATNYILQWNPPPQDTINGVIQGYNVMYFRPEYYGKEEDKHIYNVSETKLTLHDLVPYSNYSIQVAVFNRKGEGPYSAPLICATSQVTPSPPALIRVIPYNDTCLMVVWTPPVAANGPLAQYCVKVNDMVKVKCVAADTRRSYMTMKMCELKTNTSYTVAVVASNPNELDSLPTISGPIRTKFGSDVILSIGRDVVVTDMATVVLDCETLYGRHSVNWYHNNKGQVDVFDSKHYRQESNGSLVIHNANKDTNGTYECRLLGSESIKYSLTVMVISNGVPSKPKIYYHSSSIDSVFISWRCAGSPRHEDPIKSYHISVFTSVGQLLKKLDVLALDRTHNITGLSCGTHYMLQLYASNNAGQSEVERLSVRTQGTGPQWANDSLLLFSMSTHSLCFRLTEFLPGQGCPADRFQVELSPSSDLGPSINVSGIKEPCNTIKGLHPNTTYEYIVWAINNAGNTSNRGSARTNPLPGTKPSVNKVHDDSLMNIFYDPKFYIIFVVIIISLLLIVGLGFFCARRTYADQMEPPKKVNNNLHQPYPMIQPSIVTATPSMSHRNRRLPDPPCNTYDSGITTMPKINNDDDDDIKPYATYAPLHMESLSGLSRTQQGKKSLTSGGGVSGHEQTAYNAGSQAHSYQYPDIVGSSSGGGVVGAVGGISQAPLVMDMHTKLPVLPESYENAAKQPLMQHVRQTYSKGYSAGAEVRCPLLPPQQRPSESICQEPYRPGGSTWSNTTGSSTKELSQLFHHNLGSDHLTLGLREQDEDNCSTIRPVNHSTLTGNPHRMMQTITRGGDDPQESYFESGSSCDDPGIQEFTQERFRGQAIEPRFTSLGGMGFTRQSSSASSTYDSVDAPPHRPSIPFNDPSNRFARQETLPEEEESSNYQNKFVIV